jgi:hypothetical protein
MNPILVHFDNGVVKDISTGRKVHNNSPRSLLPQNYSSTPHTVIVGRGREPKENLGNRRLRALTMSFLPKYQEDDKRIKTEIVSNIIAMIQNACPDGGAFIKHAKNGRWYEVSNSVAREKVGYVFRDLLADKYKSSSKSKVARRRDMMQEEDRDVSGQRKSDREAGPNNAPKTKTVIPSTRIDDSAATGGIDKEKVPPPDLRHTLSSITFSLVIPLVFYFKKNIFSIQKKREPPQGVSSSTRGPTMNHFLHVH